MNPQLLKVVNSPKTTTFIETVMTQGFSKVFDNFLDYFAAKIAVHIARIESNEAN